MTSVESQDRVSRWVPRAALAGVLGVLMLGASFGIVPHTPAINAPVGRLVVYGMHNHNLLFLTAWLEVMGNAIFVASIVALANANCSALVLRLLTLLSAAAVLTVGLIYAISVMALAESAQIGGTQTRTTVVAYGLYAACEHAFLLAPPVLLPLGFVLRHSGVLSSRFSTVAVALGLTSIVLGLVGLYYSRPNNTGPVGTAINALLGAEAIWMVAATVFLYRRRNTTVRLEPGPARA